MDDVYLCIETKKFNSTWDCKRFDTFIEAENFLRTSYQQRPECTKFVIPSNTPNFILPLILEYKLYKRFRPKINISTK